MLGLAAVLGGVVVAASAVASAAPTVLLQPDGAPDSKDVATTFTDCLKQAKQDLAAVGDGSAVDLYVLFLLDESGSLRRTDKDNARVQGVREAITGLGKLQRKYSEGDFRIALRVAIHGFGDAYKPHGDFVSLGSEGAEQELLRKTDAFADRNDDNFTDYRQAISGAEKVLIEKVLSSPGVEDERACTLLVWFTDGEYDTDNNKGLTKSEENQINQELCNDEGPVDGLRGLGVPIMAIGLTAVGRQSSDFDLLEAIATGKGSGVWETCGQDPSAGELRTAGESDLSRLIRDALLDSLFEGDEDPPPRELCTNGSPPCVYEFDVEQRTRKFTLYAEISATSVEDFEIELVSPDGTRSRKVPNYGARPLDLPELTFVKAHAPSPSWRRFDAERPTDGQNWAGPWKLQFSGTGADEAHASVRLRHEIGVKIDPDARISRGDPDSIGNVEGMLVPTEGDSESEPWQERELEVKIRSSQTESPISPAGDVNDLGRFTIPRQFLQRLLEEQPRLLRLDFEFTLIEKITGTRSNIEHTYETGAAIWVHDPITIEVDPLPETVAIHRYDPSSYADIKARLTSRGQPVQHPESAWRIEASVELPGGTETWNSPADSPTDSNEPIALSGMIEHFLELVDPGRLDLVVKLSPRVTVGGSSILHPASEPLDVGFPISPGKGLPIVSRPRVTGFDNSTSGKLLLEVHMPGTRGTGEVEIDSLQDLPDDLSGKFELAGQADPCVAPAGERVTCEADLESSFTANRNFELRFNLSMSSDLTDPPGKINKKTINAEVSMTRPLDRSSFVWALLVLLALFVAVQTLLRVFYTFRLARWEALPDDSRLSLLPVQVSPEGRLRGRDGERPTVKVMKNTEFASELQTSGSRATVGSIDFRVDWWDTFLKQRSLIRASSRGHHCISVEGYRSSRGGSLVGLVGSAFRDVWVLELPLSAFRDLAEGTTVEAQLLIVPVADDQNRTDEMISRLVEDVHHQLDRNLSELTEAVRAPAATDSTEIEHAPDSEDEHRLDFEGDPTSSSESGFSPEDDDDGWDPDDPFA